jgi:hypothetical protein
MAIAVGMKFTGATLAQYDEVIRLMGLQPGGPGAPGGLSHWVAETPDGIRIVDVWQTKEQFERSPRSRSARMPRGWASRDSRRSRSPRCTTTSHPATEVPPKQADQACCQVALKSLPWFDRVETVA